VPGTDASASAFAELLGIFAKLAGSRSGGTYPQPPSSESLRYQRPERTAQYARSAVVRKTSLSELLIASSWSATTGVHRGGPSETISSVGVVATRIFGTRASAVCDDCRTSFSEAPPAFQSRRAIAMASSGGFSVRDQGPVGSADSNQVVPAFK
jgi:hypothetical protein